VKAGKYGLGQPIKAIDLPESALPGLEAALHLVDHIDPALAADQTVCAVTATQRLQ
jgi:hypothetical protein